MLLKSRNLHFDTYQNNGFEASSVTKKMTKKNPKNLEEAYSFQSANDIELHGAARRVRICTENINQSEVHFNPGDENTRLSNVQKHSLEVPMQNDNCFSYKLQDGQSNGHWESKVGSASGLSDNSFIVNNNSFMPRSILRRNMKARVLLVCTSLLFFATTTPYMVSSLVDHFLVNWEMPSAMKFTALWMLNTNSCINVYVYSVVYSEFRYHCRNLFAVFLCGCQGADNQSCRSKTTGKPKRTWVSSQRISNRSNPLEDKSTSNVLKDRSVDHQYRRDNKGYSFEEDTSQNWSYTGHEGETCSRYINQRERLVLVPRNDAGVSHKASVAAECHTISLNVANNRKCAPVSLDSLQVNTLPSVDV